MESNRLFPRKRKRSFSCLASRGSLRSSWRFLEARIRPIWHGPRTVLLASGPCRSPLFLLVFPRTTEKWSSSLQNSWRCATSLSRRTRWKTPPTARTRLPSVSRAHPRQPGTRGNLARRVAQGAVSGNGRCHRGTPQIRRLCLRYPGSRRLSTGFSQRSAGPPGAVIAQKSLRNIMDCFCVAVGGTSEELFGVSLEEEWRANRIAAAPCCSSRPLLPLRAVTRAHMSTEAFPAPTRYRALSVWSSTMPRARWISEREQPEWCRFTPRYAPPVSDLKTRNIVWTTWCRILP